MEKMKQDINVIISAVIIDQDNNVFLGKSPKWKNKWTIPGGKIKQGETMIKTLEREVMEETGLIIMNISLLNISESIYDKDFKDGNCHMIFIDFLCNPVKKDVIIDQREFTDYCWYNIHSAIESLPLSNGTKLSFLKVIKECI